MPRWKLAAINFDHFHMGDNLRMAHEHPDVEIVGICDEQPERMSEAAQSFQIPQNQIFVDYRLCLERTKPDVVLLCPANVTVTFLRGVAQPQTGTGMSRCKIMSSTKGSTGLRRRRACSSVSVAPSRGSSPGSL